MTEEIDISRVNLLENYQILYEAIGLQKAALKGVAHLAAQPLPFIKLDGTHCTVINNLVIDAEWKCGMTMCDKTRHHASCISLSRSCVIWTKQNLLGWKRQRSCGAWYRCVLFSCGKHVLGCDDTGYQCVLCDRDELGSGWWPLPQEIQWISTKKLTSNLSCLRRLTVHFVCWCMLWGLYTPLQWTREQLYIAFR